MRLGAVLSSAWMLSPLDDPHEHPPHVGVDDGGPAPEGEGRDSRRRVRAHPRKGAQGDLLGRHLPVVLLGDHHGRLPQAQRPSILHLQFTVQ